MGIREDNGKVYKYRELEFWARNGYICVVDDRQHKQGEYTTVTATTFRERAMSIGASLRRYEGRQLNGQQRELRDDLKRMVDQMLMCVREAMDQGDLSILEVSQFHQRHGTFRPVRVSMSGSRIPKSMSKFVLEVNRPGQLPLGKVTGRTAKADHTVATPPKKLWLPGH